MSSRCRFCHGVNIDSVTPSYAAVLCCGGKEEFKRCVTKFEEAHRVYGSVWCERCERVSILHDCNAADLSLHYVQCMRLSQFTSVEDQTYSMQSFHSGARVQHDLDIGLVAADPCYPCHSSGPVTAISFD